MGHQDQEGSDPTGVLHSRRSGARKGLSRMRLSPTNEDAGNKEEKQRELWAPFLHPRVAKEGTSPHLVCQLLRLWAGVRRGGPQGKNLWLEKGGEQLLGGLRQEQESLAAHQNSPVECSLAAGRGFLFRTCQGTAGAGEKLVLA